MEVYSPASDNLYENRSDFTLSVVDKRRNYENLQRSIQAHKNRLAMARMKKGKNLPNDNLSKYEGSGCCRQSTADTNDGFEQYRFRRHTQSSLNKVCKPVNKCNNLSVTNSFDQNKYDSEQMYIRKYDDFHTKIDQSLVRSHSKLPSKLSNKSNFSFDQDFVVNDDVVPKDELEMKVVEILGKLLLKKEVKQNLGVLSQQQKIQIDNTKVFQDENHGRMVDLLTKCISATLNASVNDPLDNLSTSRTNKSVNVEINLNMPSVKETEPGVTVNMQDDVVEESSVFIENVFDKDTKVIKDNFLKDFIGKFKKFYSTENKGKQAINHNQKVNRKFLKAGNEKFQVNRVSEVRPIGGTQNMVKGERLPFDTQMRDVVHKQLVNDFKDKHVDLEEQKLWNMGGQSQLYRKNSFVGCNFRPFSRSRSQSVHMQRKVDSVRSQVLPRNNSFFQVPENCVVRKGTGVVPIQKDGFFGNLNVNRTHVIDHQQGYVKVPVDPFGNGFKNEQTTDLGVDHTFNPFNLPQPYFNQQQVKRQTFPPLFGKQVFNGQQFVNQNKDYNMSTVHRNDNFNAFSRRNVTRSVIGDFQDNVNKNFGGNGFSYFDMVGKSRQNGQPRLQRTFNMNKKGLLEPRMLTGQFPQVEQGKVMKPHQTPMGFTVMKRLNTEPKNFNGHQVQSPGFVSRKQLTEDVKLKANRPAGKTRLLKTRSVIDTLNQLSKMNSMY